MTNPMRFCICGGGSVAHVLAAVLGANPRCEVRVLTRRPAEWSERLRVACRHDVELFGRIERISSDPSKVVVGSDFVLVAVPAFAHEEVLATVAPWIGPQTFVGALPGSSGFHWRARRILGPQARLFGSSRSPYVCRVIHYGHSVSVAGIVPHLLISGTPHSEMAAIGQMLEMAVNIPVRIADSLLTVILTPSNALVHPARLYSLFRETVWLAEVPRFYAGWDDAASEVLLGCDTELASICETCSLRGDDAPSVRRHYGVQTASELTARVRALVPLRDILTPMVRERNGYKLDTSHRFLTEDVPYGAMLVQAIGKVAGVPTPTIDQIVQWSESVMNFEHPKRATGLFSDLEGADLIGQVRPSEDGLQRMRDS